MVARNHHQSGGDGLWSAGAGEGFLPAAEFGPMWGPGKNYQKCRDGETSKLSCWTTYRNKFQVLKANIKFKTITRTFEIFCL